MAAKIIKAEKPLHPPNGDAPVTIKYTGNITEVSYAQRDSECSIRKLDKDHYIALETGEVKDFQHGINRASNLTTVAQSLRNLRDIINTNVTEPQNCLWVTLTYAENMTDHERLYQDFRKFWMRFSNYLKKSALPPAEYIVAMEPQGRGAWHAHLIIIFQQEAPYIPNAKIAEIWGFGFVKTRPLTNIDNVGLYLTAYLADMDVTQALQLPGGQLAYRHQGTNYISQNLVIKAPLYGKHNITDLNGNTCIGKAVGFNCYPAVTTRFSFFGLKLAQPVPQLVLG